MKILIGKKKNKFLWETNIISKHTLPLKLYELDRKHILEIWNKPLRLFCIETVDTTSKEIVDHVVFDYNQAKRLLKELKKRLSE